MSDRRYWFGFLKAWVHAIIITVLVFWIAFFLAGCSEEERGYVKKCVVYETIKHHSPESMVIVPFGVFQVPVFHPAHTWYEKVCVKREE